MKAKTTRQLVAILFTDIEGFSLVSNQDQERGLRMARTHHDVIQMNVSRFRGECINFYGDGSLSLFPSAEEAIQCGIEMQKEFLGNEVVPVRIGIHLGEVVRDHSSAYGDAINIAARIQSIAHTGGILMSAEVLHAVGSTKDFQMIEVGEEKLKNIPRPVRIFYVDHQDILTPQKGEVHTNAITQHSQNGLFKGYFMYILTLLLIGFAAIASFFIDVKQNNIPAEVYEAKLAVMPFHNLTGIEEDSTIGEIAADLIIKGLQSLPGTEVINYSYINGYQPIDVAGIYSLGEVPKVMKAVNLLLGKYTKQGDSIVFKAELINLETGKYLHLFDPEISNYSQPMVALKKLESRIKGYWASKEMNPQKIPNFQAYKYYMRAIDVWDEDDSTALNYLDKSIQHDSLFLDAYLLKTDWYYNTGDERDFLDWNKIIFRKFPMDSLNNRQQNSILFNRADLEGNNKLAYQLFKNEYSLQQDDLFNNITMANLAMEYVNNPKATLDIIQVIDPKEIEYIECGYCAERLDLHVRALIDLGQYRKARNILKFYPYLKENNSHTQLAVRTLLSNGDTASAKVFISQLKFILDASDYAFINYKAGKDASILGFQSLAKSFLLEALSYYETTLSKWSMETHFLLGNYQEAYRIAERLWNKNKHPFYQVQKALYQAHLGNHETAANLIDIVMPDIDQFRLGYLQYYISQVYVALSKNADALGMLEASIHAGRKFGRDRFQWDAHFIPLLDHPVFQQIIHPNARMDE